MVNTYTSNWIRVSHGDITTHNPQELVGTSAEINITNAEIQWEGITRSFFEDGNTSDKIFLEDNTDGVSSTQFYTTLESIPEGASFERTLVEYKIYSEGGGYRVYINGMPSDDNSERIVRSNYGEDNSGTETILDNYSGSSTLIYYQPD